VKRVSIIGAGSVGTLIGEGFSELGYEVIFCDVVSKDLPNFTDDINYTIENSDVSFICVQTPTKKGKIDLSYIKQTSKNIGNALRLKREYHVVTVKSTVVPTTTEEVVIPLLEKHSKKKIGEFGVCVNPEFMTETEISWTKDESYKRSFFNQDRIVIGQFDKKSGDMLEELYKPLNKPIFRTDLKTAEMIKYASNCILATKISFWNEIFLICKGLKINSFLVADLTSLDSRIGKYGTIHGKAFGGKCLPKDLKAFVSFVKKYRKPKLLEAVDNINEEMRKIYGVRE